MTSRIAVGGPFAGERFESDADVLRVPVPRPMNVWSLSKGAQLTMDIVEYHRVGGSYRWDGLIDDAYVSIWASAEIVADSHGRRLVRDRAVNQLRGLAPDKEIDGIIWRMDFDALRSMFHIEALVGGRRVERALMMRADRRALSG